VPWPPEEGVEPGENPGKALGQALETSDSIVVLFSKNSLRSPWVRWEWEYALGSHKHAGRVIPVLTPGTQMASVPWILKHIQHVPASSDWRRTTKAVISALRKLTNTG
jgi:hypothetical protein